MSDGTHPRSLRGKKAALHDEQATAGPAVARADAIERAAAGKAAPSVLDSSGNAVSGASALNDQETAAAKALLRASIFRDA